MTAFLSNPFSLPRQSRSVTSLCPRRPLPTRHRAHITVSAVTDEVRPVGRPQPPNGLNRRGDRRQRPSPPPSFVPDPTATYYTKCANCQAAYELDPLELGAGKKVACAVCGNEWFQRPDRMLVLKETEGFKEYPMENKDQLITASRAHRAERRERRDSPRRDLRDRRNYRTRPQFSIFIGNLPFSVSEPDLEELFKEKIKALRVSVVRDPTGKSRGFAFIDVSSEEEVQTAVEQLNGFEIGGRPIAVRAGRKNT